MKTLISNKKVSTRRR